MPTIIYTTVQQAIDRIRTYGPFDSGDEDYTDAILLTYLNSAMADFAQDIQELDAAYYQRILSVSLDGSDNYPLPSDLVGGIRSITYLSADGSVEVDLNVSTAVDPDANYAFLAASRAFAPATYRLEGTRIRLDTLPTSGSLKIRYDAGPLQLDNAATFYAVVSVDNIPGQLNAGDGGTGLAGSTMTVLSRTSPHPRQEDLVIGSAQGSGIYTYTSLGETSPGDIICESEVACIVPLPPAGVEALIASVVNHMLEDAGESSRASKYGARAGRFRAQMMKIMRQRVRNQVEYLPPSDLEYML